MRVEIIRRSPDFEAAISDRLIFADHHAFRKLIDDIKTAAASHCTFDLKDLSMMKAMKPARFRRKAIFDAWKKPTDCALKPHFILLALSGGIFGVLSRSTGTVLVSSSWIYAATDPQPCRMHGCFDD